MSPQRQKLEWGLRKLRHLYEQMLDGRVGPHGIATAARGLLGPAIREIEEAAQAIQHRDPLCNRGHVPDCDCD